MGWVLWWVWSVRGGGFREEPLKGGSVVCGVFVWGF